MKVQFSGVTLALLGLGALTAAGIRRGSRSRSPDAVATILEAAHAPRVNLGGDKDGWLLRQKGAQQILFTEDDQGGWCVVRRDLNRPGVLTEVWSGGADGEAAAKEAVRRNGLISIEEGRAAARHGHHGQPQGPMETPRSSLASTPRGGRPGGWSSTSVQTRWRPSRRTRTRRWVSWPPSSTKMAWTAA